MSRKQGKKQPPKQQRKKSFKSTEPTTELTRPDGEFIGSIHEAPHFTVDNRHIFKGYRINYDTPKKILRTLFMVHN